MYPLRVLLSRLIASRPATHAVTRSVCLGPSATDIELDWPPFGSSLLHGRCIQYLADPQPPSSATAPHLGPGPKPMLGFSLGPSLVGFGLGPPLLGLGLRKGGVMGLLRWDQERGLATLVQFPLAQTGEGISECELMEWFVKEGDTVEEFDNVCKCGKKEGRTKKANHIGTSLSGLGIFVKKLHHQVGDVVR
eukprot:gene32265-16831_t